MRIGFDLDGVILNNTLFKAQKLKEIYQLEVEEWKLNSNLIDTYIPDRDMRHHLGRLAGTSTNDCFVDMDCSGVLNLLKKSGFEIFLVSRRGKSNMGIENAQKSIKTLGIQKYFKECHFCETEQEKADRIVELGLKIFFDDRSEMIDRLEGKIDLPILFDPFETVDRGLVGCGKNYHIVKNFRQIENLAKQYQDMQLFQYIAADFVDCMNFTRVSDQSNLVYRFEINQKRMYFKLYLEDEFRHKDHELLLYEMLKRTEGSEDAIASLKKIVKTGCYDNYSFAIYEEEKGYTLCDLLENKKDWRQSVSTTDKREELPYIVGKEFSLFADKLFRVKKKGYGTLENLHDRFEDFFVPYVRKSLDTLLLCDNTREYVASAEQLLQNYLPFLSEGDVGAVPMDNNFKNIIVTEKGIRFIDPGALVWAPIEMGYGEFVAHAFGTEIYPAFMKEIGADGDRIKKIRIFSMFSLLNIMAFLVRNGAEAPQRMKPFGNTHTFEDLFAEHWDFVRR